MIRSWRHRWARFRREVRRNPRLPGWLLFSAGSFGVGAAVILGSTLHSEGARNALVAAAISESLHRDALDLALYGEDWATWDEARDHLLGRNPTFYARNVTPTTLGYRPLMALLNRQGQLVSGVALSADGQQVLPLEASRGRRLLQVIAPVTDLSRSSTQLVELNGQATLITIQPVRGTNGRGAPVGQLLVTRPIAQALAPERPLNRAMGIVQAHVRPAGSQRGGQGLLGPLELTLPLMVEPGRNPINLVLAREARERRTGLMAITILAAAELSLLLTAILLHEARHRQRHYQQLIQQRHQQQLQALKAADKGRDPLTGLLNATGLVQAIPAQLKRYRDFQHVLMHVDLDHFSQVNNRLGREQADRVLVALARWLEQHLHPSSLVGRLEGDKFAIALIGTGQSSLQAEVQELHTQLNQLEFGVDSACVSVATSAGARFLAISPEQLPAEQEAACRRALEEAALACDVAKLSQRQTCQFFDAGDRSMKGYLALQARQQQLLEAIRNDTLDLFGQHAWDLEQPELPAQYVELLSRLQDPATGRWSWDERMVEAARLGGCLHRLDHHVLRLAIARLGGYLRLPEARHIPAGMVFAVNITPTTLLEESFPDQLQQLLDNHQLPPQRLCLEITEQVALHNPEQAKRTMQRLRSQGVSFAMDDFGTGMTSLGYLRDLPLDYVKIDKSFIRRCAMEPSSRMVVEFIVQLGRELGFRTVAEGVETAATLHDVQSLGIGLAQGYITTRPIPFSRPSDGWIFASGGAAVLAQSQA